MNTIILLIAIVVAAGLILKAIKKHDDRLIVTLFFNDSQIKSKAMTTVLTATQQVGGQIEPKDRKGNTAKVEAGSVTYSSSNDAVATVEKDESDETKFTVKAKGTGVAQIDISADADLGEGVKTITGFLGVEVTSAEAAGFGVNVGTPEEQPEV